MKDDLIHTWKQENEKKNPELRKFLTRMQSRKAKAVNKLADQVHEEVFEKIDCLDCAGCCTRLPPMLTRTDSKRIAKYLGMKIGPFLDEYIREDEDGDQVMKTTPCPFLESDNSCGIYEVRPRGCREYPHTDAMGFMSHLQLHKENLQHCPAVFHIVEKLQALVEDHDKGPKKRS